MRNFQLFLLRLRLVYVLYLSLFSDTFIQYLNEQPPVVFFLLLHWLNGNGNWSRMDGTIGLTIVNLLHRWSGAVALKPWRKSFPGSDREKKQQLSGSEPWHMPSLIRSLPNHDKPLSSSLLILIMFMDSF